MWVELLLHMKRIPLQSTALTKLLLLAYWWVLIEAHFITAKETVLVVDGHTVVVVWVVRIS